MTDHIVGMDGVLGADLAIPLLDSQAEANQGVVFDEAASSRQELGFLRGDLAFVAGHVARHPLPGEVCPGEHVVAHGPVAVEAGLRAFVVVLGEIAVCSIFNNWIIIIN